MQGTTTTAEVEQLHRAMDTDGDGVVSREEWLAHERQAATQDEPPPPATLEWLRRGQWVSPREEDEDEWFRRGQRVSSREEDEDANDFASPAAAGMFVVPSPACSSAGVAVVPSEARPSNSQPQDIVPPSFTKEKDNGCQTTISVSPSTAERELALPLDAPQPSPGYRAPSKLTWSDELPLSGHVSGSRESRLPSKLPAIRTVEGPMNPGKSDEEHTPEVATPRSVSLQLDPGESRNQATASVKDDPLKFVPAAVASAPKRTFARSRREEVLPHGAKNLNPRTPVGGSTPGTWRPNDPKVPQVPPSPLDVDHALEI